MVNNVTLLASHFFNLFVFFIAIVVNFGVKDEVLFKRLFDSKPYNAKLPIALPDSMDSVIKQSSDLPNDMKALYPLGYGVTR